MKTLTFILISTLFFSCKKCPPSSVEPQMSILFFSIIDSEGNDLFFGEESFYDPHSVKIVNEQGQEKLIVHEDNKCFSIWIVEGNSTFYVEFIPNRTDTIKIESRFLRWYEEHKGCRLWGIYKNDVFFNNIPICIDCPLENYLKIEI